MEYILDTNIWIYLLEGKRELRHLKEQIENKELHPVLTPVIFAEVLGWKEMKEKDYQKIRAYFHSLQMLPIQMEHWEQVITWRRQRKGKKLPDLLIGANSKLSGLPIMTRNLPDFNRLEVSLENPWIEE